MLLALALLAVQPEPTVTIVAVGDILLARGVQKKIERHGTLYPFAKVRSVLRAADIAIGNLECPLTDEPFAVTKRHRFKAPPSYAPMLRNTGFDVLNLANNHMLDSGEAGLSDTKQALSTAGMGYCGTTDQQSVTHRINGLTIVFLGFTDYEAGGALSPADESWVARRVVQAKSGGRLVVASFHWGDELRGRVSARQRLLARAAAEAGADLIVGHHPHVLQPVESIRVGDRRVPVAYSLGNFVFDAPAGVQCKSAILRCTLTKRGVTRVELLPVEIRGYRPVVSGRAKVVSTR